MQDLIRKTWKTGNHIQFFFARYYKKVESKNSICNESNETYTECIPENKTFSWITKKLFGSFEHKHGLTDLEKSTELKAEVNNFFKKFIQGFQYDTKGLFDPSQETAEKIREKTLKDFKATTATIEVKVEIFLGTTTSSSSAKKARKEKSIRTKYKQ